MRSKAPLSEPWGGLVIQPPTWNPPSMFPEDKLIRGPGILTLLASFSGVRARQMVVDGYVWQSESGFRLARQGGFWMYPLIKPWVFWGAHGVFGHRCPFWVSLARHRWVPLVQLGFIP